MAHDPRRDLLDIFQAAVTAVDGRSRTCDWLRAHPLTGPLYLVACGKAACTMAQGAHDVLGQRIQEALVITKHGATRPLPWPVIEAGHPLPDAASLAAGARLLQLVSQLPPDAQVLVLLSGGASALVEVLPPGMGLAELQAINLWLLASGLDIRAMNAVRKRLSRLKGGRLAQLLHPRKTLCLAISDVPDDDPRAIGSGPLTADETSAMPDLTGAPGPFQAALAKASPVPKANDPCFRNVEFRIIATLADARQAVAAAARKLGYRVNVHPEFIEGGAVEAGTRLARQLLESEPGVVHVWGGETTVQVPARPGRGGRNQSLSLAAALALSDKKNVWLLAAGTDGSDGPTEDAGALVDGETAARGALHGLTPEQSLAAADAGTFLEASGDLIHTGPTGTNVMDLIVGLKTNRQD